MRSGGVRELFEEKPVRLRLLAILAGATVASVTLSFSYSAISIRSALLMLSMAFWMGGTSFLGKLSQQPRQLFFVAELGC